MADETRGSWGTAQEVPGSAALNVDGNATVNSVSCASAGSCAAGGYYKDYYGHEQAFVADETGGSWGTAQEVQGTANLRTPGAAAGVTSVSCASEGNCAAGGYYTDSSGATQAFVANEETRAPTKTELSPGRQGDLRP